MHSNCWRVTASAAKPIVLTVISMLAALIACAIRHGEPPHVSSPSEISTMVLRSSGRSTSVWAASCSESVIGV